MGSISDKPTATLKARVEDTLYLCDKRQTPCFYGFLGLEEQAQVRQMVSSPEGWTLFGGYPEAERQIFAAFPPYMTADEVCFPLCAIAFHYRAERALTHRDVLGTLMSAGLRRDRIGDILGGQGIAVVFLWDELADYVCEQITKIGGEGVKVTPFYDGELPLQREYKELMETVASPRLDGIVKALLHVSRDEAARLVRLGQVSIDHLVNLEVADTVTVPCTVSIKGYGRFLVDRLGPPTKKGRLVMYARKCI